MRPNGVWLVTLWEEFIVRTGRALDGVDPECARCSAKYVSMQERLCIPYRRLCHEFFVLQSMLLRKVTRPEPGSALHGPNPTSRLPGVISLAATVLVKDYGSFSFIFGSLGTYESLTHDFRTLQG